MPDNYRGAKNVIVNWPKVYLEAIRRGEEVVSEPVRLVYERADYVEFLLHSVRV